jgi:hypothetical protein
MIRAVLLPHPEAPAPAVSVACEVSRSARALRLGYEVTGSLAQLRLPPPAPSRRGEQLWRHSCCEAFVAVPGEAAYLEFNFAPCGAWASYAFRGYRQPLPHADVTPVIAVRRATEALELVAELACTALPFAPAAPLEMALAAVLEEQDGRLSYWALRHAGGKPDFHLRESFVLALPAPSGSDA